MTYPPKFEKLIVNSNSIADKMEVAKLTMALGWIRVEEKAVVVMEKDPANHIKPTTCFDQNGCL